MEAGRGHRVMVGRREREGVIKRGMEEEEPGSKKRKKKKRGKRKESNSFSLPFYREAKERNPFFVLEEEGPLFVEG